MSIVAQDPEDRPLSYYLVFTTDPKITVNSSGVLRWPSPGNDKRMIEVGSTVFLC